MCRTDYHNYREEQGINNRLVVINELPYSRKLNILKELRNSYEVDTINKALNAYELDYIRLNRIDLKRILPTLKSLCKSVEEAE